MSRLEHPESYYAATAKGLKQRPVLQGEIDADVCVIGAGYTGLSAALRLSELDYNVVVLDAARVGWGASGRNGGHMGSGQRRGQGELEEKFGRDVARKLWDIGEDAKALVKGLIHKHDIPCAFKPGILHACWKESDTVWSKRSSEKLRNEYGYVHTRYVEAEEISAMLGTSVFKGGDFDADAGHLHPLNFALGLANAAEAAGARIFELSRVESYTHTDPAIVKTNQGSVKAKFVLIACNGYLEKLEPRIAGKIMPINNMMIATAPLGEERARQINRDDIAISDTKFVVNYFRMSEDHRLLFGGGENYRRGLPRDLKNYVRKYMLQVYPNLADVGIDYAWGGTLAVTIPRMPLFGRLEPNVFYALAYCGFGVAMGTLGGKIMADAVAGTVEKFDVMAKVPIPTFPGGTLLRWPGQVAGMLYFSLRDRLS